MWIERGGEREEYYSKREKRGGSDLRERRERGHFRLKSEFTVRSHVYLIFMSLLHV